MVTGQTLLLGEVLSTADNACDYIDGHGHEG